MATPAFCQTVICGPVLDVLLGDATLFARSDEVRAAFDMSRPLDLAGADEDLARIALSCEALRTTTRMMHVLAWLLNHRAYFAGELSDFQLRRHGVLPPDRPSDPKQLAMLEPATAALIGLYARRRTGMGQGIDLTADPMAPKAVTMPAMAQSRLCRVLLVLVDMDFSFVGLIWRTRVPRDSRNTRH